MGKTNAEHQADFRQRQKDTIASLRAEVARLKVAANHAACDALEQELRAEIARLRALQRS